MSKEEQPSPKLMHQEESAVVIEEESSKGPALDIKSRLSQSGEAIQEAASSAKEYTKENVSHYAHDAGEIASELAVAAKEKLSETGEYVHSALDYIKDHLPKVSHHSEETPEDKHSRALLDEAMGRTPDIPPESTQTTTKQSPPTTSIPSIDELTPIQAQTKAEESSVAGIGIGTGGGENLPFGDVTGSVLPSTGDTISAKAPEEQSAPTKTQQPKSTTAVLDKVNAAVSRLGHTADTALSAPVELRKPKEEEREKEGGGKGAWHTIEEKMESAKEYIQERHQHAQHGSVREVSALPGDIHIPLITRAIREKVLHKHPEHEEEDKALHHPPTTLTTPPQPSPPQHHHEDTTTTTITTTTTTTTPSTTTHLGDTLSSAYHQYIEQPLQTLEDKAKWAVQHTKEELSKSPSEWQEERMPKNEVDEKFSHGEVPFSTDQVINMSGGSGSDVVIEKKGGMHGGGDELHTTTHSSDSSSGYDEFKKSVEEGIKKLDVREPGSEGEVPS